MRPTYLCVRAQRTRSEEEVVSRFGYTIGRDEKNTGTGPRRPRSISRKAFARKENTDAHALSKNFAFFVAFFIACFATTPNAIASPPKSLCFGWSFSFVAKVAPPKSVVVVVVVVVSSRETPPTSSSFLLRLASLMSLRRLFRPPGSRLVMVFPTAHFCREKNGALKVERIFQRRARERERERETDARDYPSTTRSTCSARLSEARLSRKNHRPDAWRKKTRTYKSCS